MSNHSSIDDALEVFPSHDFGRVIGTVFTGIFVDTLVVGNVDVVLKHLIAVTAVCLFSFCGSWLRYCLTNKMIPLRVFSNSEALGLDESQHNEHYTTSIEDNPVDITAV